MPPRSYRLRLAHDSKGRKDDMNGYVFFTNAIALGLSGPDSTWNDVDLSALVPVGTKTAILMGYDTTNIYQYGFRHPDSVEDIGIIGQPALYQFNLCRLSDDRHLDAYCNTVAAIPVYLIGYSDTDYILTDLVHNLPSCTVFEARDVSAVVPAAASGVLVRMRCTSSASYYDTGIQAVGAADNSTISIGPRNGSDIFAKLNSSRVFEFLWESSAAYQDAWTRGYFMDEAVFFDEPQAATLGAINDYRLIDLSAIIPDGAKGIMYRVKYTSVGSYTQWAARHPDSTDNFKRYSQGKAFGYCGVNAAREIDFYRNNANLSMDILGYFTTPTPSVVPWPNPKKGFVDAYQCFLSNYIRAKVEGFEPLKLPDGTVF